MSSDSDRFLFRPATVADADALVAVMFASRRTAMPWLAEAHTDAGNHWWMRHKLVPGGGVTVVEAGGDLVALMALAGDWVEQLYVAPGYQGRGIGRTLIDLAKMASPDELNLYCFARNEPARRFYEANGFTVARASDGSGNEEREADVTYRWTPVRGE